MDIFEIKLDESFVAKKKKKEEPDYAREYVLKTNQQTRENAKAGRYF